MGGKVHSTDAAGLVRVKPERIEAAADEAVQLLIDNELRQATVTHNFEVVREHYSMAVLQGQMEQIIARF